jgi:hypothetical protein
MRFLEIVFTFAVCPSGIELFPDLAAQVRSKADRWASGTSVAASVNVENIFFPNASWCGIIVSRTHLAVQDQLRRNAEPYDYDGVCFKIIMNAVT